jgi:hypothetical protein
MTQRARKTNGTKIPHCEEKERLVNEFVDAVRLFTELHSQQTQAVIDGDPEFARFDDLIHMARETKDKAKYSLIAHMEEHCC